MERLLVVKRRHRFIEFNSQFLCTNNVCVCVPEQRLMTSLKTIYHVVILRFTPLSACVSLPMLAKLIDSIDLHSTMDGYTLKSKSKH